MSIININFTRHIEKCEPKNKMFKKYFKFLRKIGEAQIYWHFPTGFVVFGILIVHFKNPSATGKIWKK